MKLARARVRLLVQIKMKTLQSIFCGAALVVTAPWGAAQTPTSTQFNVVPSRIVGQPVLQQQGTLTATAPNLVEGREFRFPQAIALDTSAAPPILYVADTGNNRVLAWKNALAFTAGAPFADKVIGQRDLITTSAQGPGFLSTGLSSPVALAVDKSGNLYVADGGNNRILRYPAPFSQTGDLLTEDLIIGQKDLNGRNPNEGLSAPTEKTLAFSSNAGVSTAGLAFDAAGNLWVTDPVNNRVLRYPVSALGTGAKNEPAADLVLGQNDFVTGTLPTLTTQPSCGTLATGGICGKNYVDQPAGLAFDQKGRLFVADLLNRVVVFTPPLQTGQLISRIMGFDAGTPPAPPPVVSASTLGIRGSTSFPPNSVFFIGNNPYVVDTGNARILGYDPFDQWADEGTTFSPPAKVLVGQPSFQAFQSNRGFPQPTKDTLAGPQPSFSGAGPAAAAFFGTELFVVDTGNQRVIVFPQQAGNTFGSATRLLGQFDFQYNSINLIEGREVGFVGNLASCVVNNQLPFSSGGGAVVDGASNPPHLYIADPLNNRVLGFLDARKVTAGASADLVIGQPDFRTALINYPNNSATQTNDQGLWAPEGLAVDANGDLFVADTCNARVLRFPVPFAQPQRNLQHANLVLGQVKFFGEPDKNLSRQNMRSSYGMAFSANRSLVVSDPLANRILFFRKPTGGDFQVGAPATNVFGQKDFVSVTSAVLSNPHGVSIDPDDQLYVADTGNNRIAFLPNVTTAGDNPAVTSLIQKGMNGPESVFVNQITDEVWVTNTFSNQLLRYPHYQSIIVNDAPNVVLNSVFGPVFVGLDAFGNPVVAEASTNRVLFFYPAIDFSNAAGGMTGRFSGNAANYLGRFAPGMLASIFPFANARFGDDTVQNSTVPVPTTLGDVQVLVAGVASPLLYVSPNQINFQVPNATPTGGLQEIQVVRASTGQVLASWLFNIDVASPGLFTSNSTGSGQISAVNNDDGKPNGPGSPAKAGSFIALYGTGTGVVDGGPPDGQPASLTVLVNTSQKPKVFINSDFVPDSDVTFSGLAPGYVGLWQINVKIPKNAAAAGTGGTGAVPVFVFYNGVYSTKDSSGVNRITTIWVSPVAP
jgi:uncharacterized protein (TIGR03437 family)